MRLATSHFFDGMENPHKGSENRHRQTRRAEVQTFGNLCGQISNTPDYLAKAFSVCQFFHITATFAAFDFEAAPQTVAFVLNNSTTVVTGDSDLLAFGGAEESPALEEIVIVQNWLSDWFRIIKLNTDAPEGQFPMLELYHKHGCITFQLYAACNGCDFTESSSGLPGIGFATFIKVAKLINNQPLTATNLATSIWNEKRERLVNCGFETEVDVELYLQRVVDIYQSGEHYDSNASIVTFDGKKVNATTSSSMLHMRGDYNSRTRQAHTPALIKELEGIDCSPLLHQLPADVSHIIGIRPPNGKTIEQLGC